MPRPKMQKADCEIVDREMQKAILDMCQVINVGFFDDEYPYVIPLNYGYSFEDDLVFFTHHALKGHKLGLIEKNPNVCVETNAFADGINNPRSHTSHDFRSIVAFGKMEQLKPGTDDYKLALRKLYECNGRAEKATEAFVNADHSKSMLMFKITCKPENVSGKAQNPLIGMEEIPLPTEPKKR